MMIERRILISRVVVCSFFGRSNASVNPRLASQTGNSSDLNMRTLKFIVEQHSDGCIAYPWGLRGVVMGQGDSYGAALTDAKSAAHFYIESFGAEAFDDDSDVEAAYVAEGTVAAV